jgi:hypothetical protein
MKIRRHNLFYRILFLGFAALSVIRPVSGQELPYHPVSYRMLTPFIFNPAIAGSKDFSSIDYNLSKYRNSVSNLVSGSFRIPRSEGRYYSSLSSTQYTGAGLGGYAFDDFNGQWRNTGFGASLSYHIKLDRDAISFLSFGLAGKAVRSRPVESTEPAHADDKKFFPDADAGIYFYSASFYAGISATNLLDNHRDIDSLVLTSIPYNRQVFFNIGYKFILSRKANIILEPSLIANSDERFSGSISEIFKPSLKLYAGNFCAGTFLNEPGKIPFFIQYKYSKVYLAAFFEIPSESAFFKQPVRAEFAVGINLSAFAKGYHKRNHW